MTTFVLLHGAYQGGWIWNPVAERLRAQGHLVFAPTLDGCAERKHRMRAGITTETHAEEIAALLFYNDLKDVVLVGTSTGGMVMAGPPSWRASGWRAWCSPTPWRCSPARRVPDIVKRPTAVNTELTTRPVAPGFRDPPVRRSRSGDAGMGDRALHAASDRAAHAAGEARAFLEPAVERLGDLVPQEPNPPVAHQRRACETLKGAGTNWTPATIRC